MLQSPFTLRRYRPADEDAAVELWRRTWQLTYPSIDFSARLEWWRQRWRNELVPVAVITVAEAQGCMIGFVTVDPVSLDFFFFNDTATTEIYTLSLHDALPI